MAIYQDEMTGNEYKVLTILFILPVIIITSTSKSFAQASSFYVQYFQNRYITNPAMAGTEPSLNINIGYQQLFSALPGSPKLQYLTVDYGAGSNVGLRLNVEGYQSGLINSTRATGAYAYHLPVSEDSRLNFGIALGFVDNYIESNAIIGNTGDVSVSRFNQHPVYVDGDFGISFTGKQLTVQAAIPNLKSVFFKNQPDEQQVDLSSFYTSVSYKILSEDDSYNIEPLIAFRGIRNNPEVLDAGVNFDLTEYDFNISGIYHTNQSATFAFGLNLNTLTFLLAYTDSTAALKTYSNNTFELGLKIKVPNKRAR